MGKKVVRGIIVSILPSLYPAFSNMKHDLCTTIVLVAFVGVEPRYGRLHPRPWDGLNRQSSSTKNSQLALTQKSIAPQQPNREFRKTPTAEFDDVLQRTIDHPDKVHSILTTLTDRRVICQPLTKFHPQICNRHNSIQPHTVRKTFLRLPSSARLPQIRSEHDRLRRWKRIQGNRRLASSRHTCIRGFDPDRQRKHEPGTSARYRIISFSYHGRSWSGRSRSCSAQTTRRPRRRRWWSDERRSRCTTDSGRSESGR